MMTVEELYALYKKHPVVCTDTRAIIKDSIFFALKGDNFNGNSFAESAIEKGASYTVIDEDAFKKDERFILVDDVLKTLQQLANHHRKNFKAEVLAITGSNGKTTTKELTFRVLSKKFQTLATKGNLNNHIGIPLTLLSVKEETEIAIVEMGANHLGEIKLLCEIAEPDYGIITNVGKAHLEGFGSFDGVKKGKGEMYDFIAKKNGTVFINGDNVFLKEMGEKSGVKNKISYGKKEADCVAELSESFPFLKIKWMCRKKESLISTQLIGEYNFENILSAICIGNYFDVPETRINQAIAEYIPDNNRSQVLKKGTNTIVLDAYNANPSSVAAALKNFSAMPGENKIIYLGEMAELGSDSEAEHKAIVELIRELKFTDVILTGKKFKTFSSLISCHHFENSETSANFAREKKYANSTILIKGSRSSKMEKVMEAF